MKGLECNFPETHSIITGPINQPTEEAPQRKRVPQWKALLLFVLFTLSTLLVATAFALGILLLGINYQPLIGIPAGLIYLLGFLLIFIRWENTSFYTYREEL